MTKDEMKNKISMALKDPILQQGFEIICKELEQERKLNAEIKARFVKCNTCTPDMKDKCLMFSENLCEGERCEELVDLMALVNKNDLQEENEQQKAQLAKAKEILQEYIRIDLLPPIERNFNDEVKLFKQAQQFLKGENIILEDAQAGNSPLDADEVFNKEMKAYSEEK